MTIDTRNGTRLEPAAALFHSLADPARLAIVKRLTEGRSGSET